MSYFYLFLIIFASTIIGTIAGRIIYDFIFGNKSELDLNDIIKSDPIWTYKKTTTRRKKGG